MQSFHTERYILMSLVFTLKIKVDDAYSTRFLNVVRP